jgi:hypothetical protein
MADLLADYPSCSFGFLGAKKSDEDENKYGPVRQPVGYMDSDPPFASL